MSFSRPFQWYHFHADPIWPDGTLKSLNPLIAGWTRGRAPMGPGGRRRRRGGSLGTSPAGAPSAGRGRGVHPPPPLPLNTRRISSSFYSAKYSCFESVWFTCKNLFTLQFLLSTLQFLFVPSNFCYTKVLPVLWSCGSGMIFFSDPDPAFQLVPDPVSDPAYIFLIFMTQILPLYSCLVSVLGCSLWQDITF
jgi:hypothetical protein